MRKFDYFKPETLKEAFSLMEKQKGDAKYIAGGTDVIVGIRQRVLRPNALISLRHIEKLDSIEQNGAFILGSMTRFRDIERHSVIRQAYPVLHQAVSVLANPQIRNVATIGGNICNAAPSADCAPPLLVLEAVLTLEGPGGKREIAVDDFFTGPGENVMMPYDILTKITIPVQDKGSVMAFMKKGRLKQDIAVVNAAALLVMEGKTCKKCRLATGAVAPVPMRLKNIERMVEGEEISEALIDRVSGMVEQEVSPITDVRSTGEYRRIMSGVLIKRAMKQTLGN